MVSKVIPEAALSQHVAILGKTRSGKTNSAKLVIEQVAGAGSRVCVIDPIKADYWGLTSSANGKHAGLPFHIVGGSRGHVPLHAGAGAAIAGVVASGALKLSIIDMENFGPKESGPFFAAFMETIFRRIQGVLYLVVDEAHLFAPKEGRGGDESMATYWFKRMASGSGSKGVRLIVSTQRVQELHNTVLSNCDTVIAHRVTFPEDQKRISDWVASHATKDVLAEVKRSLPNLHRGEAWICSGEAGIFQRRQMPLCTTYDNSRTPTEDEQRREVKTATIDRDALRAVIGDAVKEAEANDPKLLKAEIARLKREQKPAAPVDDRAIERAHAAGKAEGIREAAALLKDRDRIIGLLKGRMDKASHKAVELTAMLHVNGEATPKVVAPEPVAVARQAAPTVQRPRMEATQTAEGGALSKGGKAILNAIAQYGAEGCDTETIAVLTGYKATSRYEYLRQLKASGYVEGDGPYRATDEGIAALGSDFEPLPTGAELREYWQRRLTGGEAKLFESLIAAYPSAMTSAELQEATGYKSTSTYEYGRQLTARRIATNDRGTFRASDELFE